MALFSRSTSKAAVAVPQKAAAAGARLYQSNVGKELIGQYYTYTQGWLRERAMQVPAISRARDLHASLLSSIPLYMYKEQWNDTTREMDELELAPRSWLRRPDPSIPYATIMAWTLDDLFMLGRAFWWVSSRTQDGFPASFSRLPAAMVTSIDQQGPVWYAPSNELEFNGGPIDSRDVVQFIGSAQGILTMAAETIETALKIENARQTNAASPIPSGVLRQTGGEDLTAAELQDLAEAFAQARQSNSVAALNQYVTYEATSMTPDKMLLIDSANYSAVELSRQCNVPFYLNGCSIGSYSYQSSDQARKDLWLFGTQMYASVIEQTLSGDNVLPRGTCVAFDIDDFLADTEKDTEPTPEENTQEQMA